MWTTLRPVAGRGLIRESSRPDRERAALLQHVWRRALACPGRTVLAGSERSRGDVV